MPGTVFLGAPTLEDSAPLRCSRYRIRCFFLTFAGGIALGAIEILQVSLHVLIYLRHH